MSVSCNRSDGVLRHLRGAPDGGARIKRSKKMVYNLTQHQPTDSQVAAGVQPPLLTPEERQALLDFPSVPTEGEIIERAERLVEIVGTRAPKGAAVMIGGALWLQAPLGRLLKEAGYSPLFAYSERRVTEVTDGSTTKKVVEFVHSGWVPYVE
jgi:hypothetical protein